MVNLKEKKVLVTATTFGKSDPLIIQELISTVGNVIFNPYGRPMDAVELAPIVSDVDGIIAGLDVFNAEVISAAHRLKIIARYGVGFEKVDLEAATGNQVLVTNTPGANSASVAELAIGLMLALARHLVELDRTIHDGEWKRSEGISLRGKTVGLIGLGAIGTEVAKRLTGFECKMIGYDPFISNSDAKNKGVELVDLDDLASQSDIISLHVPVVPSTIHMINRVFLSKLKKGVLLINTARGQLIDEDALVEALESGQIAGAGLDAFATEPPGIECRLLQLPQVLATPHTGAHTDDAVTRMSRMAMDCCLLALQGKRPPYLVNPSVFEKLLR